VYSQRKRKTSRIRVETVAPEQVIGVWEEVSRFPEEDVHTGDMDVRRKLRCGERSSCVWGGR
jgi:hypothetical protein